ncbi:MAG: hypothetical protein WC136_03635 [Sphaerochaeta sp.]|jgi:hypothetical protein
MKKKVVLIRPTIEQQKQLVEMRLCYPSKLDELYLEPYIVVFGKKTYDGHVITNGQYVTALAVEDKIIHPQDKELTDYFKL